MVLVWYVASELCSKSKEPLLTVHSEEAIIPPYMGEQIVEQGPFQFDWT